MPFVAGAWCTDYVRVLGKSTLVEVTLAASIELFRGFWVAFRVLEIGLCSARLGRLKKLPSGLSSMFDSTYLSSDRSVSGVPSVLGSPTGVLALGSYCD